MKKFFNLLLAATFSAALFAAPPKVKFTKDGFIDIDGIGFSLVWMDKNWKQHAASSKHDDAVWKLQKRTDNLMVYTTNPPDGTSGKVTLKITPGKEKNCFVFSLDSVFEGKCTPNFFGITAQRLSVGDFGGTNYVINGKKSEFSKKFTKYTLWSNTFDTLEIPSKSGKLTFTGPVFLHMQDNRRWSRQTYGFRIGALQHKEFTACKLVLPIKITENDRSLGNVDRPVLIMKEGKDYKAFNNKLDVVPGSALDFSGRLEIPAGKHGFLKVKGGKFYFENAPDKPVKFFGTNLVGTSQVMEKEKCEILARRLASFGFNCVRIHHHDNEICDRKDTRKLDPALVDMFDYLIYCFKKNGIYITTDVYVSRRGITKHELPKYGPISGLAEYKALFWVDDDVFENWKSAARNFFTHINPYTKTALINDPVLVSLSLVNEGNPHCWRSASGRTAAIYKKQLALFRKTKGNEKADMDDFCSYLAVKRYKEMKKFVQEELGCKVPLSDQNFQNYQHIAYERAHYDYADNHAYWDHPRFVGKPWSMPISPGNVNVLKERSNVPSRLFPTRVYGMPFMVTEYDYANPNIHRMHGPALFASYAAFQDWDGVFQFAYSHSRERMFNDKAVGHFFDLTCDPGKALAYKLGAKIFLYGKVKPAETTIALIPPKKSSRDTWSEAADSLGFIAKLGSHVGKTDEKFDIVLDNEFFKKSPINKLINSGKLPKGAIGKNGRFFYTPQLRFDTVNGNFRLNTDGAEVISLQANSRLAGNRLTVENTSQEVTVGLIPHDTDSLTSAKRLVLIHLSDTQSQGRYYLNDTMSQMNAWGTAPFLVKRAETKVSLKLRGKNWKIYSLDLDGTRKKTVPYTIKDNKLVFTINTADQMACELVRE